MGNANEFFSTLGKTLSRAANTVGKKTDEFVTVQKIRSRKNNLEEQVEVSCRKMGEMIFQQYADGEKLPEELARICQEIEKKKQEIADCREQIALVKGGKLCPSCGSLIPKESRFCMNCGASFPEPEEAGERQDAAEESKEPADRGDEQV